MYFHRIQNMSIQSVMCIGLKINVKIIGALYLDHRFHQDAFDRDIVEIAEAFAEQVEFEQRCHWHVVRDMYHVMHPDGAKLETTKRIQKGRTSSRAFS